GLLRHGRAEVPRDGRGNHHDGHADDDDPVRLHPAENTHEPPPCSSCFSSTRQVTSNSATCDPGGGSGMSLGSGANWFISRASAAWRDSPMIWPAWPVRGDERRVSRGGVGWAPRPTPGL